MGATSMTDERPKPDTRRSIFRSIIVGSLGILASRAVKAEDMPDSSVLGPFHGDFLTFPPYQGQRSAGVFQFDATDVGKVAVMPVRVDRYVKLRRGRVSVAIPGSSGTYYYFGAYDAEGRRITWAKFPIDAAGFISAPLSRPILLRPGLYRFCVACDDPALTGQGENYLFDSDLMNMLPGGGLAENRIENEEMPECLGDVVEPWPYSAPYICLS